MQTDFPSDRPDPNDAAKPGSPSRAQDGQEIDEADIPILFETIETAEDAPTDLVETDQGVVTLSLTDAVIDDDKEPHQAPLVDPYDEDGRHHHHSDEAERQEMQSIASLLAAPESAAIATQADTAASLAQLSDAQLPGASPQDQVSESLTAGHGALGLDSAASDTTLESTKPHLKKGENPFLPQHILDKLNQGRRNLVEEIAQSSAALDASTARLRSRTRSERFERINELAEAPSAQRGRVAEQRDQLIDDLVEEFLPLIAAELRRRLKRMLKD